MNFDCTIYHFMSEFEILKHWIEWKYRISSRNLLNLEKKLDSLYLQELYDVTQICIAIWRRENVPHYLSGYRKVLSVCGNIFDFRQTRALLRPVINYL